MQRREEKRREENRKEIVVAGAKPGQTIESRIEVFKSELHSFLNEYGREMLNAFFMYWSEPNKSRSKMRFEQERTWDLPRRLARWAANDKGRNSKVGNLSNHCAAMEDLQQQLGGVQ